MSAMRLANFQPRHGINKRRSGKILYGYPEIGRYGLTHGILAWARCAVWCEETGALMIAPIWLRPRIGPYLRRERDKRNYFLLFKDRTAIGGVQRAILLARTSKREAGMGWPSAGEASASPEIMVFRNALADNEKKFFHQLIGHGPFLRKRLLAMTRPRYRPKPMAMPHIAIHVRMGDFAAPLSAEMIAKGANNTRLPLNWYADRLAGLRVALGLPVRAIIYSDGSDEDLQPLTALPDVMRAPKQQSITDLLAMGTGVAVISSGSGFSLWGAFLGNAPRLCHPGQMIVPAYDNPAQEIESAFGDLLPDVFVQLVHARLES